MITSSTLRVALFGSFYRGFCVLNELLYGPLSQSIHVVGVATDDPKESFVNAKNRVWQYPHLESEEKMVRKLAISQGIETYTERVKTPAFYDLFESQWRPDICIMATFGQRIDQRLYSYPAFGFFNLHPSDNGEWPSRYAGSNPFDQLIREGAQSCVISMHHVDDGFDTGKRIAVSEPIYLPHDADVTTLHKISSPIAALLVREQLQRILQTANPND